MKKYLFVLLIFIALLMPLADLKASQDNFLKYLKLRKDSLALAEIEKVLLIKPDDLSALWAKAEVLRRAYKLKEAEEILQQVLTESPQHAPSLISLSYIRYHDNHFSEALGLLKSVLCQSDLERENKALAYMLMGSINAKRASLSGLFGKIKYGTRIRNYFEKAKALAPDLAEVHLGLGTFYLLAPGIVGGNLDKAISELELALNLAPDFATPYARLAQAYKKKGDLKKYDFYLRRAEGLDPENEALKEKEESCYKEARVLMGTFVEVTCPDREAGKIVFSEIARIEGLLSKYNPESEIAQLNLMGSIKLSRETFYIIKKAKEFWQLSDGAFDITVAPLVDLWGFSDKKYTLPKEEEIKNTLAVVGSDKIILQEEDNVVKFKLSGMRLDLGAIAKGYALDCAVNKLRAAGIRSCLLNAGGQIYALGDKFGQPWRVAIQDPRSNNFSGYLTLKDRAVATSGDYQQYFMKGNKRYGHIFNPKTGYPAESGVISATVIADDGLTADALATAIFVLGKEKGEALAKKYPGVEVRIMEDVN